MRAIDETRLPSDAPFALAGEIGSAAVATELDDALERFASVAVSALDAVQAIVFVTSFENPNRIEPAAVAPAADSVTLSAAHLSAIDTVAEPAWQRILAAAMPLVVVRTAGSSELPATWLQHSFESAAVAPLHAFGKPQGLLVVGFAQRRALSAEEIRALKAIADAAAARVHVARLSERAASGSSIQAALAANRASLLGEGGLSELLDAIADAIFSLLPDTSFSINLLSADRRSFRVVAFRGSPPSAQEIALDALPPAGVRAVERLWRGGSNVPIVAEDVQRLGPWDDVIPPDIGPGLLAPLRAGGELLGFLAMGRRERPFDEEETRIACAFAEHAALAASQARMRDALKGRLRASEALTRLSDVVLKSTSLKAALTSLNRGAAANLGVRCVRARFSDPRVSKLLGLPPPSEADQAILRAWRGERPKEPLTRTSGVESLPEPIAVGSMIALPIPVGRGVAGILWLHSDRELDHTTLEFANAVAAGLGDVAYKARLRRTADRRAQELAVAVERERIAQDLHENVGEIFFALCLRLQDLLAEIQDPEVARRLAQVRAMAARGLADMRSAVFALSSLNVRSRGFVPSLRALARHFKRDTGVRAEVRVEGKIAGLSEDTESALFRVAHEALLNVDRHARATGVIITIAERTEAVELLIRDDGVGLDQRQTADWRSAAHFGMRNMARSVEAVGGRFRVTNARPRGLAIRAIVPALGRGR